MTTLSLAKHSEKYRKVIRDGEINHIFKRSRILLQEFTVPQAINRLQQVAVSIKANLMNRDSRGVALDLTAIHSVAAQYFIVDYLLSELSFSGNESVRVWAELPLNCTLVDIVLLYVREEDEIIREECAALLQISIEQIGRAKTEGREENLYKSQIQRILEHFPFELLWNCSNKTIVYLLNSLQEIVLLEDYWYKNESFCNKLDGVFELIEGVINQNHSNKQELIEIAFNSALIFLYHVEKLALSSLFNCSKLQNTLKTRLLKKMANSEYCDIDLKKLKVLIMSKAKFIREQFQIIQGLLETEIKKLNYFYFVTINILTHYSNFALQLQSIKLILMFLFKDHSIPEELQLVQIIASLNYKNAKLYKEKQASHYSQYLLLMIQYFDIDTILPLIQTLGLSHPILIEQIIATLSLIQDDVAAIDPTTAAKWRTFIEKMHSDYPHSFL